MKVYLAYILTKQKWCYWWYHFAKKSEVLYNLNVKQLKSDHGIEYRNETLKSFCEEKGIVQNSSTVRTPQQNGVAEQRNLKIIEVGRTTVVDADLSLSLWAEAVNTTCYT